jgi:hypothetical protein
MSDKCTCVVEGERLLGRDERCPLHGDRAIEKGEYEFPLERGPSSQLREKYELAYRNSSQQQNRSNGSFHAGIVAALTEMAKLDGYELSDLVTIN